VNNRYTEKMKVSSSHQAEGKSEQIRLLQKDHSGYRAEKKSAERLLQQSTGDKWWLDSGPC
jgi:hypothetical protein